MQIKISLPIFAIKHVNMVDSSRFKLSPFASILLLLFLVAIGFVLFLAIGVLVATLITGNWEFTSLISGDASSFQGLMALRIIQIFQTIGVFLFPALVFAIILSKRPFAMLGFKSANRDFFWLSAILMFFSMPAINLIASINAEIPMPQWMVEMEQAAEALTKAFMITENYGIFALNLLMVGVLPALGEELFFRGVLQKFFCKQLGSNFLGVVLTALIFSAVHLQFQGFIPRFLLGMVFGYLFVWTGSIWIPILMHFINNSLAVMVYFMIGRGLIPAETDTIGGLAELWQMGVISLVISVVLLWVIRKKAVT